MRFDDTKEEEVYDPFCSPGLNSVTNMRNNIYHLLKIFGDPSWSNVFQWDSKLY